MPLSWSLKMNSEVASFAFGLWIIYFLESRADIFTVLLLKSDLNVPPRSESVRQIGNPTKNCVDLPLAEHIPQKMNKT